MPQAPFPKRQPTSLPSPRCFQASSALTVVLLPAPSVLLDTSESQRLRRHFLATPRGSPNQCGTQPPDGSPSGPPAAALRLLPSGCPAHRAPTAALTRCPPQPATTQGTPAERPQRCQAAPCAPCRGGNTEKQKRAGGGRPAASPLRRGAGPGNCGPRSGAGGGGAGGLRPPGGGIAGPAGPAFPPAPPRVTWAGRAAGPRRRLLLGLGWAERRGEGRGSAAERSGAQRRRRRASGCEALSAAEGAPSERSQPGASLSRDRCGAPCPRPQHGRRGRRRWRRWVAGLVRGRRGGDAAPLPADAGVKRAAAGRPAAGREGGAARPLLRPWHLPPPRPHRALRLGAERRPRPAPRPPGRWGAFPSGGAATAGTERLPAAGERGAPRAREGSEDGLPRLSGVRVQKGAAGQQGPGPPTAVTAPRHRCAPWVQLRVCWVRGEKYVSCSEKNN